MNLMSLILSSCVAAVFLLAGTQSGQSACPPPTVKVLTVPFSANSNPYNGPPAPDNAKTLSATIQGDLSTAFGLASATFLSQLCGLDGIFIDPTDCGAGGVNNCTLPTSETPSTNSWGFREHPSQYPLNTLPVIGHFGRYIAISAGLWSGGTHAPNFDAYQTTLVGQLLNWTNTTTPSGVTAPNFQAPAGAGAANGPGMTVLAALAHEFGHVLFYDTFRPTPGGGFDFHSFCRGTFFQNSWQDFSPPPVWRQFGDTQNQHKLNDVEISDLALAVSRKNFKNDRNAAFLLNQIHKPSGHWASLLAAFSPDEDFVETFVLDIITTATGTPVTTLPLVFSDGTTTFNPDVVSDILSGTKKEELRRKIRCLDPSF
jgi:hypothetical protein